MNKKYSKTDGENRIVDGDIVEFGNENNQHPDNNADARVSTSSANLKPIDIPKMDISRMCACYDSVQEVLPHIGFDSSIEYDLKELKDAFVKFETTGDSYRSVWRAIQNMDYSLKDIKESLEKIVNKDKTNNIQNNLPPATYKYILTEMAKNIDGINKALLGYEPMEDNENHHMKDHFGLLDDFMQDIMASKSQLQTTLTIEFTSKQYQKMKNEIAIYSTLMNSNDPDITKRILDRIENLPQNVLTVKIHHGVTTPLKVEAAKMAPEYEINNHDGLGWIKANI